MTWDFQTGPELQQLLDRADEIVRTEVHRVTVAKRVLRDHRPVEGHWPSRRARYAQLLEHAVGSL